MKGGRGPAALHLHPPAQRSHRCARARPTAIRIAKASSRTTTTRWAASWNISRARQMVEGDGGVRDRGRCAERSGPHRRAPHGADGDGSVGEARATSRTRNTSFPGLLKTIFRLLGIPPLNLFDAAATDLSDVFTTQPDLRRTSCCRWISGSSIPRRSANPPAESRARGWTGRASDILKSKMRGRAALLVTAAVATLLAQRGWREFPAFEYNDFPIPPDYQEKTEFVFARLMYPNAAFGGRGFGRRGFGSGDWREGGRGVFWTMDYPRSDRHLMLGAPPSDPRTRPQRGRAGESRRGRPVRLALAVWRGSRALGPGRRPFKETSRVSATRRLSSWWTISTGAWNGRCSCRACARYFPIAK